MITTINANGTKYSVDHDKLMEVLDKWQTDQYPKDQNCYDLMSEELGIPKGTIPEHGWLQIYGGAKKKDLDIKRAPLQYGVDSQVKQETPKEDWMTVTPEEARQLVKTAMFNSFYTSLEPFEWGIYVWKTAGLDPEIIYKLIRQQMER